jgi:soluble lytic murein transglycosylase
MAMPMVCRAGQAIAAPKVSPFAVQAAKLALAGKFAEAGAAAKRSQDEAAAKLVELIYLRDNPKEAGYARIMDFLDAAPKWPLAETLLKRAEKTLYSNNEAAELILAHFASRKPVTPEGALALARARLASGDTAGAAKLVRQVWTNPAIDAALEKSAAAEFKSFLALDDHQRRMWRLVHAQESNAAIRVSKRLGGDYQAAAKVAQGLLRGVAGADKQYAKLPAGMREQVALKYALARYYRKLEKYGKARAILAAIPGDPVVMGDMDAWWAERRIVARHSIGINHKDSARTAYQIARAHGFTSGEGAIEGEFLAGWIALRSLKEPARALKHFERLAELAETRTEKARARYWQGRTFAAMDRSGDAKSAYREASQYSTVYYGQLAREQLGLGKIPEEIPSGEPSAAARAKVDRDDVMRAFKMVAETGSKNELYMFLWAFANRFDTADDMNAAASVVWTEGGATMALRLAKAAAQRGVDIDSWGYPVNALPGWKQIGRPVEKALVFGLSRQESEFNASAGSVVGAQGLMQIMPATAKLIARRYGLSYRHGMLTGDPAYNVKLGAAHLGDLIDDFGGSYVLTLVAYNAGPRRSREWVAEYGDLRNGEVDPIDWVESIPFQETRQYVQKVLQNIHVYRSRLAPETVRPMTADLSRGSVTPFKIANTAREEKAAACDGGSIADIISKCE